MSYVLIVIAAVLLAIFLASRRKGESAVSFQTSKHEGCTIPAIAEMLEADRQDNNEVIRPLESANGASGLFLTEKITEWVSKLRGGSEPFARVNTKIAVMSDQALNGAWYPDHSKIICKVLKIKKGGWGY